jgi:hypothetical protein
MGRKRVEAEEEKEEEVKLRVKEKKEEIFKSKKEGYITYRQPLSISRPKKRRKYFLLSLRPISRISTCGRKENGKKKQQQSFQRISPRNPPKFFQKFCSSNIVVWEILT